MCVSITVEKVMDRADNRLDFLSRVVVNEAEAGQPIRNLELFVDEGWCIMVPMRAVDLTLIEEVH